MAERVTLNRFPLFGLFAYRAALRMGYPDTAARLLGYSTALLYAIFKNKAQSLKRSLERADEKKLPAEVKRAKLNTVLFGGKEFLAIYERGKKLAKTIVGHEVQTPDKYDSQVEAKFPAGWHERLAEAFDRYLAQYDPGELNEGNTLFELYRQWRDECKVGFNRVDLNELTEWLERHTKEAQATAKGKRK